MPAGTFTESNLLQLQIENTKVWGSTTTTDAELEHPVGTATALLENQDARSVDILEAELCTGAKVYYQQSGGTTIIHSGATARVGEDCTQPTGVQSGSYGQTLTQNIFLEAAIQVNEKCDNEIDRMQEASRQMKKAFTDIAVALNNDILIPRVMANAQANIYAQAQSLFGITPSITAGGNVYKMDPTRFDSEALIRLRQWALHNKIGKHILLAGGLLQTEKILAKYYAQDDDKRRHLAMFDDSRLFFDSFNIDNISGNLSVFIINPSNFFFWNRNWSPTTPEEKRFTDGTRTFFSIPHPFLKYKKNGVLIPIMCEVEYGFNCASRKDGRILEGEGYFIRVYGGSAWAPPGLHETTGASTYTGTLHIIGEA